MRLRDPDPAELPSRHSKLINQNNQFAVVLVLCFQLYYRVLLAFYADNQGWMRWSIFGFPDFLSIYRDHQRLPVKLETLEIFDRKMV